MYRVHDRGPSLLSQQFQSLRQTESGDSYAAQASTDRGIQPSYQSGLPPPRPIRAYNHSTHGPRLASIKEHGLIPGYEDGFGTPGGSSASLDGVFVALPGNHMPYLWDMRHSADVPVFSAVAPESDYRYQSGVAGKFPLPCRPIREVTAQTVGEPFSAPFPLTPRSAQGAMLLYQFNGDTSVTTRQQAAERLHAEYSNGFPEQAASVRPWGRSSCWVGGPSAL